jgi:hypothetical protein
MVALVLVVAWCGPGTRLVAADSLPGGSLESLTRLTDAQMKRVSSYDRTGGNRDGLHDAPILPGETRTLAEIDGEGAIAHIWCTVSSRERLHLRRLVVRMYWDGEETPSVEVPLGDFFAQGHGLYYDVNSAPIQNANSQGMNCYWRMPFEKGARITLTNEGDMEVRRFFFHIDYYQGTELVDSPARFHAQYRQAFPTVLDEDYTVLDAQGRGLYVGTVLSVQILESEWWGEGDERIYVDGAKEPQFHGTGTEDYFGGAWCYPRPEPFNRLYFGNPLRGDSGIGGRWSVYRFHVQDPIPFQKSLRFTIEHGHASERTDNWSSVAYWYQTEPHAPFPALPAGGERGR